MMIDRLTSLLLEEHAQRLMYSKQGIYSMLVEANDNKLLGIDMSIESVSSQSYSNFIFGFLIVSLIIFGVIIYFYLPKKKGALKTGEKIMFGAIIMGMVIAVAMGYTQLIGGYLF